MNGTLIRDNIPANIEKQGDTCNYAEIKSDYLFNNLIRDKLVEVVNIFLQANTVETLAEVKAVVEAIGAEAGETFNKVYEQQMAEFGGYTKRYAYLQADYGAVNESKQESIEA